MQEAKGTDLGSVDTQRHVLAQATQGILHLVEARPCIHVQKASCGADGTS